MKIKEGEINKAWGLLSYIDSCNPATIKYLRDKPLLRWHVYILKIKYLNFALGFPKTQFTHKTESKLLVATFPISNVLKLSILKVHL